MKKLAAALLLLSALCQIPCRGKVSQHTPTNRNPHPLRCERFLLPCLTLPRLIRGSSVSYGRSRPVGLRTTDPSDRALSDGRPVGERKPPPPAQQPEGDESRGAVDWIVWLGVLPGCVVCGYALRRIKYYRRCRYLAEGRMRLFRRLLELAYLYRSNPVLFQKKFCEEVSIDRLQCCDIICGDRELKQLREVDSNPALKNRDILLCILLEKGFTPQELSVIYGMNNYNSIYVRLSRIRKRRSGRLPLKTAAGSAPAIEGSTPDCVSYLVK